METRTPPHINISRIESDLYKLAEFGANPQGQGITRQGFTDPDLAARRWVLDYFMDHGMTASMDGAGNVIGHYGPTDKPALLIASHLDSVPMGGMFDGVLGVIAGLEVVRVIRERNIELTHPIEVIGTSEEEGRFGGMLGAQALSGHITLDWLEQATDPDGQYLKDAMADFGFDYHNVLHARKAPDDLLGFLELHIEQGPVLEAEQKSIGIVEGISGVFKWHVQLIGKADHAGTAPMNMRSDAFMGMADFGHEIYRIIDEEGTDKTRITIGRIDMKPGFAHTVPGEVDFTLVGRDMDEEVMRNVANTCRKVLSSIARKHRLMFEYREMSWLPPVPCDPGMIDRIEAAAQRRGYSHMRMPSGAGHDAQFFTDITPTGMIFVPSQGGVSHAPDEWTHWNDIEQGCNVLLDTVLPLVTA